MYAKVMPITPCVLFSSWGHRRAIDTSATAFLRLLKHAGRANDNNSNPVMNHFVWTILASNCFSMIHYAWRTVVKVWVSTHSNFPVDSSGETVFSFPANCFSAACSAWLFILSANSKQKHFRIVMPRLMSKA